LNWIEAGIVLLLKILLCGNSMQAFFIPVTFILFKAGMKTADRKAKGEGKDKNSLLKANKTEVVNVV